MPLELPKGWCSLKAPKNASAAKWDAVKDAPLNENLRAYSAAEAHALAKTLMRYQTEGDRDNWQPPVETVEGATGDCEDFAILARRLLLNGGYDSSKIWLLIVKDLAVNRDHALLWIEGEGYLDVRAPRPLAAEVFTDYRPILAFNDTETLTFGKKRAAA